MKIIIQKIGSGTVGVADARADGMAEDTFVDHAPLNSHVVNAWSVVRPKANGLVVGPADRDVVKDHVEDVRVTYIEADTARAGAGRVAWAIADPHAHVTNDDIVGIDEDERIVVHFFAGKFNAASRSSLARNR